MLYGDLVAANGRLITLDNHRPRVTALAVRDGRFVFVGDDAGALALCGPETIRINLEGRTVTPGFCDAHLHLASFGVNLLRQADLAASTDFDDLLSRLAEHAATYVGEWIQGRGFDQERMAGGAWPTRAGLDRLATDRPILITRVCGHAAVANSIALSRLTNEERAAGDADSGRYTENALAPFHRLLPPLSDNEMASAILRAAQIALHSGITSVGTMLDPPLAGDQLRAFHLLNRTGALPIRVTAMPPYGMIDALHRCGIGTGFGDNRVRIGGAKLFSDGSLGAGTALLREPYADAPRARGIRVFEPAELRRCVADAQAKGFQAVIHAIGDGAVADSLDAIESALGATGKNSALRHRIEHASLLPPDLLARMAAHGIIGVVQPQFVPSDDWIPARVGPARARTAYPFRAMLDAGIPLGLSSDCPIEPLDAFACLDAAVNRAPWSAEGGLDPEEAIRAYCLGSAYSLGVEAQVGSLETGKLADFVVLSGDPTAAGGRKIGELRAERVFVEGREAVRNGQTA
jgi:predicted amidohydrolase YtcJ